MRMDFYTIAIHPLRYILCTFEKNGTNIKKRLHKYARMRIINAGYKLEEDY